MGAILRAGGISLRRLADRFGTPLYVYDAERIRRGVDRFASAFSSVPLLLAYAVKANGSLALLNRIGALGAGADIVSLGELRRVERAGIPAGRVIFSGVGKTERELEAGLRAGIHAFHAESQAEVDLLSRVAGRLGLPARLGLRLNPDVHSPTPFAYTRTGHAATKFGIPVREAEALYTARADDPNLHFVGVGVHIGSQIAEVAPYLEALDTVLGVVDRLLEGGIALEYVDLGGGFGVAYESDGALDLEALATRVVPEIRGRGLRLVLEPGRAIVGEAGLLLARVLYTKCVDAKHFIVTDASMTELLRPSHYGAFHRIRPVERRAGAPTVRADIVGPVCESGDFLARGRRIELPEPGDLLAVETAGAYGFAMASNYNGRPRPAEVLIEGGEAVLVRERESLEDLMRGETIPPLPGERDVRDKV
ncbi:MAG: diaminopimelate decarboxylase [Gammaproteobacteria bacterium]|nr:diaminopimelate decarboxylase [Gammaproteobacteria bacterium]MDE0247419.1 diaminopimelate decarboxylase [Gammaproteobacteria bacterium]